MVDRQLCNWHGKPMATPLTKTFGPVARAPQVSASIAEQILSRIKEGELPVGARLPTEAELAKDFGVSRPSVREALAALQFSGHVESRRGFGTVVVNADTAQSVEERRPLQTLREAVDLLETRLVLEPYALAAAAEDPDREALKNARRLIDGMRAAVNEPGLHASTDIRVHRSLLATCRNAVLRDAATRLVEMSLDPMLTRARTQAWSSDELPHRWTDHHEAVYEAIRDGDPKRARSSCLAHLASVVDNLAAATADDRELEHRMRKLMADVGLTNRPISDHHDEGDDENVRDV